MDKFVVCPSKLKIELFVLSHPVSLTGSDFSINLKDYQIDGYNVRSYGSCFLEFTVFLANVFEPFQTYE